MFKSVLTATILALGAQAAEAQNWQPSQYDTGSILMGGAGIAGDLGISFGCTAPSPQGRSLIETGSHETNRTDAFEFLIEFHDDLFQWSMPYQLDNVVFYVGQTGYRMPAVHLDELSGTSVTLPMSDPFFTALFSGASLVLDTGQNRRIEYGTDGLREALQSAMGYCAARWQQLGHIVPVGVSELIYQNAASPAPTPNPTESITLPQFLHQEFLSTCNGGYRLNPEVALGVADFDTDGVPDYLFSGHALTCNSGLNPYCGAAQCSFAVYLSSRGHAEVDGWIGGGFSLGTAPDGRHGFYRFADSTRPLEIWNGSAFAPAN